MSREMVLPPGSRQAIGSRAPVTAGDGPSLFAACPELIGTPAAYDDARRRSSARAKRRTVSTG